MTSDPDPGQLVLIHHKSACRFAESTVEMHAAGRKRDPAGRRIWKIVDRTPAIRAAKTRNMGPDLQVYARREGFEPPTARSVAWCSASLWSAPDGNGLLTLDGSSVQTDPDGSRRIVWMIKRMIKQARLHNLRRRVEAPDLESDVLPTG